MIIYRSQGDDDEVDPYDAQYPLKGSMMDGLENDNLHTHTHYIFIIFYIYTNPATWRVIHFGSTCLLCQKHAVRFKYRQWGASDFDVN